MTMHFELCVLRSLGSRAIRKRDSWRLPVRRQNRLMLIGEQDDNIFVIIKAITCRCVLAENKCLFWFEITYSFMVKAGPRWYSRTASAADHVALPGTRL